MRALAIALWIGIAAAQPAPPAPPAQWAQAELVTVQLIDDRFVPDKLAFKSGDYAPTGVFILRVTNIEPTGVINKNDAVFLPLEKVTKEIERFKTAFVRGRFHIAPP